MADPVEVMARALHRAEFGGPKADAHARLDWDYPGVSEAFTARARAAHKQAASDEVISPS